MDMIDLSTEGGRLSPAWLLRRIAELLRGNAIRAAVALVAMTALGLLSDMSESGRGAFFLVSIATLVLQYWLTVSLLDRQDLRLAQGPRFAPYFFLGIVTSLAIALGLVLLVIPGIVLMVRWSIATPAVIADEVGITDAIGYSWRETEGHFWPILGTLLVVYSPYVASLLAFYLSDTNQEWQLPALFGAELALNISLIAGWHAGVAIFAETRPRPGISEVFA